MPNLVTEPYIPRRLIRSRRQSQSHHRRRSRSGISGWLILGAAVCAVIMFVILISGSSHPQAELALRPAEPMAMPAAGSYQEGAKAAPIKTKRLAPALRQSAVAATPEVLEPSAPSAQLVVTDIPAGAGDTSDTETASETAGGYIGSVVPDNMDALAVAEGEAKDSSWFSDAVMIGDSRMDGFRMYSGVSEADYIVRAGMTVWEVAEEKRDIAMGGTKYSTYQVLGQKQYAKVYLSIGINELGYYNPTGYAETYGKIIDKARELQPNAQIYVMALIPVNAQVCRENGQRDYINNDLIWQYNDALVQVAAEKGVLILDPTPIFTDENGELSKELTSDGVHFKKDGYTAWKDYLLCHTGT